MCDVGIWTCAGVPRTKYMVEKFFTKEERKKFKFVYTQADTYDTEIQRKDITDGGKANVLLKDFRKIFQGFDMKYIESNTVLIDDSPIKAFANPRYTSLFPTPFTHTQVNDDFLGKVLYPYL